MIGRERENGQTFGVFFTSQLSRRETVLACFCTVLARYCSSVAQFGTWNIRLVVLLEVKLSALPRNATKDGISGGFQSCMGIADNEMHATQAMGDQALQKGTPVDILPKEGVRETQNASLARPAHPAGNQNCRIADLPILTHLLVADVQEQIHDFANGLFRKASTVSSSSTVVWQLTCE